jgi:hypothetical protein
MLSDVTSRDTHSPSCLRQFRSIVLSIGGRLVSPTAVCARLVMGLFSERLQNCLYRGSDSEN